MRTESSLTGMLATAILVSAAMPINATTLIRANLDDLATDNSTIVLGKVVESYSYWNADGTFIFTDIRVLAQETLKGDKPAGSEFTFTIMGGTVGDLTTLIIGGPELTPGKQYVLFLNEEDLPSVRATLTVRDHIQGVFDVKQVRGQLRAVSQANRHALVPDAQGKVDVPGGLEGLVFDDLRRLVREHVGRLQISDPEMQ